MQTTHRSCRRGRPAAPRGAQRLEVLRRRRRHRGRLARGPRRADQLPARRQRRRQVDPDQDAVRRPPPRRGDARRRRPAGALQRAPRRARCRDRDRLPGPVGDAADEHQPQLLPRQRADQGVRAVQAVRQRQGRADRPRGDEEHRDRGPRHGPAGRDAVGRRTPDAGHRPRRVLRRAGPDPRRTDLGARRQGVRDRPAPRHLGPQQGTRGHLHHPQRPARPADRRLVHDPDPRPVGRHVQARRAQRRRAPPTDGRRLRARGAPGRPRDPRQARGSRRGDPDRPDRRGEPGDVFNETDAL